MSFVINLNPTNPTYLVKCEVRADGILSPLPATWVTETTQDINRAKRFANAWLADEVARDIRGWGGTQRVQQIASQVLETEDDRRRVRDICTDALREANEAGHGVDWECPLTTVGRAAIFIMDALGDRGLKVDVDNRATNDDNTSPQNPLTVYISDRLGNTMQLDWNQIEKPILEGHGFTITGFVTEERIENMDFDSFE